MSDAFEASGDAPRISREQFSDLNAVGYEYAFGHFLLPYRKWLERVAIRHVSPSQYLCLIAIVSRTLYWRKIAEVIPLSVFRNGLRQDYTTELLVDTEGMPFFSGTGLAYGTISTCVTALEQQGLIARFAIRFQARDTFVFLPFSLNVLNSILREFMFSLVTTEPLSFLDNLPRTQVKGEGERILLERIPHIRHFLEDQQRDEEG